MSVWSLSAAAVLTGLTVGAQQGVPVAQAAPPAPAVQIEARQEDSSQRVSVDFDHAQVSEVLNWLSKNGASFIAADSELPKDATVTMSIKDQPLDEVADALAAALGGHWERRGDVRAFRKGGDEFGGSFMMAPRAGVRFTPAMPGRNFKVFRDGDKPFLAPGDIKLPDMQNLRIQLKDQLKDLPKMSEEQQKEMERAMAEAQAEMAKSGDEMKISQKAMEEAHKAMEKAQREHPEAFGGDQMRISEKAMEEAQRAMEKAQREHPEAFSGDQMRISEKAMEEAQRAMEKARREHPEAFRDGDSFFIAPPGEKGRTFMYRATPGSENGSRFRMEAPRFSLRDHDFTKLMNSLSPEQRELNRRQGYLRASDLTESQRNMIGVPADGKGWTIKINKDGDEVTIKSDR